MKIKVILILGILVVALVGTLVVTGCGEKADSVPPPAPGPGERAGAVLDKAIEKSGVELKKLEVKTGEVLEKVGVSIEKTGSDMQIGTNTPNKP